MRKALPAFVRFVQLCTVFEDSQNVHILSKNALPTLRSAERFIVSLLSLSLFEVAYAGQENLLILVAGNVAEQARSKALAVAHLAEDTSVGAGDTFDSIQAAVRVERSVHGRYALSIYILGSNLAVSEQLFDSAFQCVEAAFAVRYSNCMLLTWLA